MLFKLLKSKLSLLKIPSVLLLVCLGVGCAMYFGTVSISPSFIQPTFPGKKTVPANRTLTRSIAKHPYSLNKELLEKELTTFQPISHAVIAFSGPSEQDPSATPKLSVVLSLYKQAALSAAQVYSITDYLIKSIPGLSKEHITISDSLGNIYAPVHIAAHSALLATSSAYLERVLPKQHFSLDYIPHKEHACLQISINEKYLSSLPLTDQEKIISHAEHYLNNVYDGECQVHIEVVPFANQISRFGKTPKLLITLTIFFSSLGIVSLASFYLAFYAYEYMPKESKKLGQGLHIPKLVEILKQESPEKISLILSYLEPQKAEELFNKLPENIKKEMQKL